MRLVDLDIGADLLVDEVGNAYARIGAFVMRAGYRLLFRAEGSRLVAIGAEAAPMVHREGRQCRLGDAIEAFGQHNHAGLQALIDAMLIVNIPNAGLPAATIALPLPIENTSGLSSRAKERRRVADGLAAEGFMRPCLIHQVSPGQLDEAKELSLPSGDRLMICGFEGTAGQGALADLEQAPILRLSANWFRQVTQHEHALRLLTSFVSRANEAGAQVLVEDIRRPDDLRHALEIGADLLLGPLLAPLLPTGSLTGKAVYDAGDLLEGAGKVLDFRFRNGCANRQWG